MNAKRNFIICILTAFAISILFMLSACSTPSKAPETGQQSAGEIVLPKKKKTTVAHDKLGETFYAGRVTEIGDNDFTIILGEEECIKYSMSDKARQDIESLGIDVDTRVIVTFEKSTDGTLTALSVDKITME